MREALVYALGVAISPLPIATALLLLTTRRALANGLSFLAGWTVGVTAVILLLLVLVEVAGVSDSRPLLLAVAELLLGTAFLLAAVAVWRRRHVRRQREAPWLNNVDRITTARSAGLGVVLSGANPKVAALSLGAALALSQADTEGVATVEGVVLFAGVAALGVLVPVAAYATAPSRAESALRRFRAWLGRNEAIVLAVLGLLIGSLFLVSGAESL